MTTTTTAIYLLFFLAYLLLTYYFLLESASPTHPCNDKNDEKQTTHSVGKCAYPLVSQNDKLSLELWIYAEQNEESDDSAVAADGRLGRNRKKKRHQWIRPVNTCSSDNMIIDLSKSTTTTLFDKSNANCTLYLPDSARRRFPSANKVKGGKGGELQAKFLLRRFIPDSKSGGEIVAEAPFTLTRMVEKLSSPSIWSFNTDSSPEKAARKLLQSLNNSSSSYNHPPEQQINNLHKTMHGTNNQNNKKVMMMVPHFKYRSQSIVLRIVSEYRPYGYPPFRGDGTLLQFHPNYYRKYKPIFYVDDIALRYSSQIEVAPPPPPSLSNATSSSEKETKNQTKRPPVPINIKVSLISPLRDVINTQVSTGISMAESVLHETEMDEIKYLISDEHIYRFILTNIISFIHVWLDYLAFRNEVGFYVGKTDLGGLSVSSVVTRFVCSLIIFLYLLDGGMTSMLILISVGSGVVVDGWKVWKILKPEISFDTMRFPFVVVTIRDLSHLSETEIQTQDYDRIAITYLSLLLYPLIAGSALYALQHYAYTSWYSWLISNLANAVYTFGFIALCPQLYVNYRLKSVAHMPWKVFMYKLFNTFIDDLFAFLIKMPLKHKIMTLRDDVVFLVFLVQAWIYRVDKSRPNEFGYVYDGGGDDASEAPKDGTKEEKENGRSKMSSDEVASKLKHE